MSLDGPSPGCPGDAELPLRERKKRRTRRALADTALRLFGEHGYDRVTLEQLAAQAEVARSTVFRYFATKEDLAIAAEAELWDAYVHHFSERAADGPELALTALRESLTEAIEAAEEGWEERFLETRRLAAGTPVLRDHSNVTTFKVQERLVSVLERRLDVDSREDVRLRLLGEVALGAWRCGARNWVAGRGYRGGPWRGGRAALILRVEDAFDAVPASLTMELP